MNYACNLIIKLHFALLYLFISFIFAYKKQFKIIFKRRITLYFSEAKMFLWTSFQKSNFLNTQFVSKILLKHIYNEKYSVKDTSISQKFYLNNYIILYKISPEENQCRTPSLINF